MLPGHCAPPANVAAECFDRPANCCHDFDKMQSLVINRLRTIYLPAHALSFRTDPMFN
jgi:hypothetical protein